MSVKSVSRRGAVTTVAERPGAKAAVPAAKAAVPAAKRSPRTDAFKPGTPPSFDLAAVLGAAARVRRGPGPEGGEPLLTAAAAARVTKLFAELSPPRARALQKLITSVPDGAARALMLEAIAARASRLGSDERPFAVLARFAKLIAPLPVEQLLERATVLDLDSRVSTSDTDLVPMWSKRGTIRGEAPHGEAKDNDGLFQRFTATCGPTVIQMMRAQADPVLAFAINSEGLTRDSITGETARFQRALLEEYGGIAIGRRESYVLARLHNAFARLELPTRDLTDANIAAVRARYDGFPSDDDLRRVRAAVIPTRDEGIGFDEFHTMLERYVSHVTGAHYTQTSPADGFARGQARRHFDDVERALKAGYDVPAGMVEPAHWVLLSDVRGRAGSREFLISDPDGGRTAWVTEKALGDGSFGDAQFHLAAKGERPYVDSFFLPAV